MNERNIPVLTIRQPWAWLIVEGHKDIENRTWATPYRGPLLIHAGKSVGSRLDFSNLCDDLEDETGIALPIEFPLGEIVGIVTLSDIRTDSPSVWAALGDHHWILTNPCPLPPLVATGKLGLWTLPASVWTPETDWKTAVKEYVARR